MPPTKKKTEGARAWVLCQRFGEGLRQWFGHGLGERHTSLCLESTPLFTPTPGGDFLFS